MEMTFEVAPCSRKDLRSIAKMIRKKLKIRKKHFPIVEVLDLIADRIEQFRYEIVEDAQFPFSYDTHAYWDPCEKAMKIRESVYNGACEGKGRDRMTIAHELGHFLLHSHQTPKMCRTVASKEIPAYKSSEWQAKAFAAELLMPYDKIKADTTPASLAKAYGVSEEAAMVQLSIIRKEKGEKVMDIA